ncbi:hypothetical protein FACS1894105_09270 [Clostridia bacterium]|nr:hypothetical protein FACS1894105_09270 [Clostridia bacterium]
MPITNKFYDKAYLHEVIDSLTPLQISVLKDFFSKFTIPDNEDADIMTDEEYALSLARMNAPESDWDDLDPDYTFVTREEEEQIRKGADEIARGEWCTLEDLEAVAIGNAEYERGETLSEDEIDWD